MAIFTCLAFAKTGPRAQAEEYEWVGNYIDQARLIPSTNYWSAYEGAYWLGLKVPGLEYTLDPDDNSDDDALFGTEYDPGPPYVKLPPWHLHRGGTIYFGDFTHRLNSSISRNAYYSAHDLVNRRLDVQSGKWTFDFAPVNKAIGVLSTGSYNKSGSYTLTDAMYVGNTVKHTGAAGEASLTIKNGVLTAPFAALANVSGSNGNMTVTGDKAQWIIKNNLGFGDLHIGEAGKGVLTVERGGLVDVAGETVLGVRRDSSGKASITQGARFNSGSLVIGGLGRGTLYVSSSGKVEADDRNVYLGTGNDAFGDATITGAQSSLTKVDRLTVGGVYHTDTSGRGRLTISNGGLVTSQTVSVGNRSRSRGDVTVTGAGSEWTAGHMMLGDDGRGNVLVTNQGHMTTGASGAVIGNTSNGIGNVTVNGGGRWDVTTNLIVGGLGLGTLDVGRGGTVAIADALQVGSRGEVKVAKGGCLTVGGGTCLDGGALTVGPEGMLSGTGLIKADVFVDGGMVSPGNSPGALRINGDYTQLPGSTLLMEIAGNKPGVEYDQLLVSGDLSLRGDIALQFLNGFVPKVGDTFDLFGAAKPGFSGRLRFRNAPENFRYVPSLFGGRLSVHVVPEPATALLATLSILALGLNRKRL